MEETYDEDSEDQREIKIIGTDESTIKKKP
jgi:hypothetical protein